MSKLTDVSEETLQEMNSLPKLVGVHREGAGSSCTGCYIEEHTNNSMAYWKSYCVPSRCEERRDYIMVKSD